MKKRILIITLALFLMVPTAAQAVMQRGIPVTKSPQDLYLNGLKSEINGYNIKGYNYFKLRDIAAILMNTPVKMSLQGDGQQISVNLNQEYTRLPQDLTPLDTSTKTAARKLMTLNVKQGNETATTDVIVYNIEGFNYFQLREMGRIMGFGVDYDQTNNRALVSTGESISVEDNTVSPLPTDRVVLGNEVLFSEATHLIDNKRVGIITNQTGVNYNGERTVELLKDYPKTNLVAAYSPEHGLDGKAKAGEYVSSYIDKALDLPVYSLYGKTREPSADMLKDVDVLLYDMQDIGSRTYTYISTLNYSMRAAAKNGKKIVVLDRPNPVGGEIVEGFVLKDKYKTFVGVDNLPMAHGMTVGELAKFFNRNINADLEVIPMKNYNRSMVWQDTGLKFVQTSPNITSIESAFNYMATGIGEGTGIGQADKFAWVGGKNLNSREFANKLNSYNLPGVNFIPENKSGRGGVKLQITDYHTYNPARTGVYILATANLMRPVAVNVEKNGVIPMFEKIMGSNEFGKMLTSKKTPEEIVRSYANEVEQFKQERQKYLIYN